MFEPDKTTTFSESEFTVLARAMMHGRIGKPFPSDPELCAYLQQGGYTADMAEEVLDQFRAACRLEYRPFPPHP